MMFGHNVFGGLDFLKMVKDRSITTPVVITTGNVLPALKQKSLDAGAMAFIPKPMRKDDIVDLYTQATALAD